MCDACTDRGATPTDTSTGCDTDCGGRDCTCQHKGAKNRKREDA